MKNQIGKLFQRLKSSRRTRVNRLNRLSLESLEGRRLLAFDVPNPYQNDLIHEDVSGDYNVAPLDALIVVNALNGGQGGELPGVEPGRKADGPLIDVNGDNHLTALDALMVTNYLNGEGETTPTARFSYQFVDTTGAPLASNQVVVGDIFQLQTFVQDTRGFSAAGINAAYLDIAFDNDAAFDVAVGEIQSLKFFVDKLDLNQTDSSFTLSFNGQTTVPIALFDGGAPRSDTAIAASMQEALEDLANIGEGNVTAIVDQAATSEDQQNMIPRFNFEIRFGNELAGQDLNLITLDPSNVGVQPGETFEFAIAEVLAGDQSNPQAEASAFLFADLYDFARRAEVTSAEFNDVGAASQEIPLPSPAGAKLLFTVPLVARAAGVINFTPNEADNPPSTDIVTGVTVIPTSMVDYGTPFSLTVITDPTAPVAVDDSLSIPEDGSLALNGNVTNNDTVTPGRTLVVASAATTANTQGTLNGLTYIPPANFFGTDEITYIARDSSGLESNVATVTITVTPENDAPIANDDDFVVDEDSTNNPLDVLANDNGGPGEAGDVLTIQSVGSSSIGATIEIAGDNMSLIYTPPAGVIGQDSFTYVMQDQDGLTAMATVRVSVEATILPRGRDDSATTDENQAVMIDVLANDRVNPESSAILLSAANGTFGTVTINDNGTPTDQTDDKLTYTPNDPNFYGTDSFTYVMDDTSGLGEPSTGTVTIMVNDINDPPILMDDNFAATEDVPATISINFLLSNDSPGAGESASENPNPQTLALTGVTSGATGGSVEVQGENVIYTPAQDFNGTYTFTYDAIDDGTNPGPLSGTGTVTIQVRSVDDPPVAADDSASTREDESVDISTATLLSNDSAGPADESSQMLSVTGVSATSAEGGSVSLSGDTVTYTPAADFFGTDTFTYSMTDGNESDTATVTVTVSPVNDAPVPGNDSTNGFNKAPIIIQVSDLLANDTPGPANESDQSLSIVAVTPTADTNGMLMLNNDGTITLTVEEGFVGTTSFEYTVQDNGPSGEPNENSATGVVEVTVRDFAPTDISGVVWVDETLDGVIDADERRLGGVRVTLTGVSLGQTVPTQTVITLADGTYSFESLGPGQYVVSYAQPYQHRDGLDVAGALGDADNVENQFTIDVAEPGGFDGSGYNFAVVGLDATLGREIDQLASRYTMMNSSLLYNGIYFGLQSDNTAMWSTLLDGFEDAVFAEAVMIENGRKILLTIVDDAGDVFTATLGRGDFVKLYDSAGNAIIRVLGARGDFSFQQVNRQAPPFTADKYLDSVDEVFAQEGW